MAATASHASSPQTNRQSAEYEQPLNERMRTFLRLEFLYQQMLYNCDLDNDWATRAATSSLLEIMAILARGDIRSDVHKELDHQIDVLEKFQACCLPSDRVWTGKELFTKFDSLASEPVFMPLYRRYADTAGFPDTSDVLERLGINVSDDVVSMRRNAELQVIRQSITETNTEAAGRRQQRAGY